MAGNAKAFTLAELLTAMLVMSIIAVAVAGMSMALSTAHEYSKDFYRHSQIARNGMRRIGRAVRQANLITATDSTSVAYWAEDTNGNGRINLTEMRLLTFQSRTGELAEYRVEFPAWWEEWMKETEDAELSLSEVTTIGQVESLGDTFGWTGRLWATELTDASFVASPSAPQTKVLQVQFTVGQGSRQVTLRSAAGPRIDWVQHVGTAEGQWILDT